MTAIQKAREALVAARYTLSAASHQLTDDHKIVLGGKRWGEVTSAKIAAALAALDAETEATPADVGEEPVAAYIQREALAALAQDKTAKATVSSGLLKAPFGDPVPLYSATALERVVRDRDNLQARLTARAKSMLRLREALAGVHDNIEDEGDRTYFGSTNDADTFREVWQDLDAWAWDDIMSDGKMTDVYAASREAHTRAESAEAKLAEARKVIEPFARAADNAERLAGHDGPLGQYVELEHLRAARRFLEETK